ncbi:MAG: cbb3-type cytochrome c oxidase N-terminal domain-containing protein [Candidatus Krumholzibacteriia bacterium]
MSDRTDTPAATDDGYVHDFIKEHEFDGIQEFDNKLPNWWLWTLYGAIVFSVLYWIVFHTLEIGELPREKFAAEMLAAQEAQLARAAASGLSNETFVMMATMEPRLAEGREIYVQYCVQCHLDDGSGSVGPNLTDEDWIHGCDPMAMYKVITDGVAAKGMPAWLNQLGPTRVQAVVSYLLTLQDKNVPGKPAEGEPCTFAPGAS